MLYCNTMQDLRDAYREYIQPYKDAIKTALLTPTERTATTMTELRKRSAIGSEIIDAMPDIDLRKKDMDVLYKIAQTEGFFEAISTTYCLGIEAGSRAKEQGAI